MTDTGHSPPRLHLQGMLCVQADIERQCMRPFTQEDSNREFLLVFASHSLVHFEADIRLNHTSVSTARLLSACTYHVVELRDSGHNDLKFREQHKIDQCLTGDL